MTANANDGLADRGPVFIVGAGPSGLTAAYRLRAQGIPAVVLEKRDRTGGMIHTHREQGYLMEEGATILPSAYEPVVKLANEIGSGPDLIPAGSIIGFARDDTIYNLRSDTVSRRPQDAAGVPEVQGAHGPFRCRRDPGE
ncbi:FAD-dependent oxidoreductase [Mycobacterium sp.]|uniref:FAD-dependent oxidoreductase n=1 Tax=Mycobacterium sp. TaxID=1785 RepID=UPI003F9CB6D7